MDRERGLAAGLALLLVVLAGKLAVEPGGSSELPLAVAVLSLFVVIFASADEKEN